MTCPLGHLLPELANHAKANQRFSCLTEDSRAVEPGCLYLARAGAGGKGLHYLTSALKQGPAVVIADRGEYQRFSHSEPVLAAEAAQQLTTQNCELILVDALEVKRAAIAAAFYGKPAERLTLIGITGTNGKTSCASFIAQALGHLGKQAAVIGTLGNGPLANLTPSQNTTPGPLELHALFAEYVQQGITHVVMEVSSHALDQGRVDGLYFEVAAFTNLTHDHLDYHGTMEAYANAKAQLFAVERCHRAVINCLDHWGLAIFEQTAQSKLGIGPDIQIEVLVANGLAGSECKLTMGSETFTFSTQQLGEFVLDNLAICAGVLKQLGVSVAAISETLGEVTSVAGRMERIDLANGAVGIVDYAHTPDALEKLLHSAQQLKPESLICVFGCGGDRDRQKRAVMGDIASRFADTVLITSDNPRGESPQAIIDDIFAGVAAEHQQKCQQVVDRKQAIEQAVAMSQPGDLVVVAGKGHEDYQEVNGQRFPFSDQDTLRAGQQEQEV
ncbi:MAG: UDP-N-acetylmuramoyl-L-alanyl-D-glutamate--2,6-diaminopimelate ligase [Pontibacterium sp.]